ncbi:MAG: hypothetical protein R3C53_00980 [Pirellulaceae bacterium]
MKPLRIVWLGEQGGGLQWLRQRLQSFESVQVPAVILETLNRLPSNCSGLGVDRLIVGSRNRLNYPLRDIEQLQRELPEIPLALATDTLWDGAGRSGVASVLTHLTLPWHRWWDGWVDWLAGTAPQMFGPCPTAFGALSTGSGVASIESGIILSDCRQSGEAWQLVAMQVSGGVQQLSWSQFLVSDFDSESSPHWLLWDEPYRTVGDTVDRDARVVERVRSLAQRLPGTHLILASSLPRSDQWLALQTAGVDDLLTNPNTGRALQRLLLHLGGVRAGNQNAAH